MNEYKEKAKRKGRGNMKIREVLDEINSGKGLPKTATEINIGRDRLQKFLHTHGYSYDNVEKKWLTNSEAPAIVEEDIYSHLPRKGERAIKNKNASNINIKTKNNSKPNSNNASKRTSRTNIASNSNNDSNSDNDMKAQIKALITGEQDSNSNKVYKGIYFDKDIARFLDSVKHGNKSELVNKIIRAYLLENDLMK